MSSEFVNLTAIHLYMREGGVLKHARMYMFSRRRTSSELQRHLSAKYIEQRRCFDKYQYNSQLSTKLPKFISLAFQLFLQRAVKYGNKRQKPDCRFCTKFCSVRTPKKFLNAYWSWMHSKSSNRCLFGHLIHRSIFFRLPDFVSQEVANDVRKSSPI